MGTALAVCQVPGMPSGQERHTYAAPFFAWALAVFSRVRKQLRQLDGWPLSRKSQLTKRCSENVVVTKNYCYGNVTENVKTTLVWMFFYVLKTLSIVRKFIQQFWNVFNVKQKFW